MTATKWAGIVAALFSLEYAAGKTIMAARGELGVPGHPAPPEATAGFGGDIVVAQLGNAALGLVSAALALAFVFRWGRRVPRAALAAGATVALLSGLAGAVTVAASLTGLREDHGQWGIDSLVLGVVPLGAWTVLFVAAARDIWQRRSGRAPRPGGAAERALSAAAATTRSRRGATPLASAAAAAVPRSRRGAASNPGVGRASRRVSSAVAPAMRPGRRAALVAAAACAAYGALKLQWALGGEWLLRETPLPDGARQDMLDREPGSVASHWASVALAAIGIALAVATVRARRAPWPLVVGLPALLSVLMLARAGWGLASDLSGDDDYAARWDLFLWSPFFALWGSAWGLAALARHKTTRYARCRSMTAASE